MSLKLEVKLDQDRCIRGQSVFFTITLTNAGSAASPEIASFDPFNRALRLVVRPEKGKRFAGWPDGFARRQRDAADLTHWEIDRMSIDPGKSVQILGDVLAWVGELPVGASQITAVFDPMLTRSDPPIQSAAVSLLVIAAKLSQVSAPRLPQIGHASVLTTAWTHETGPQRRVFLSGHSRRLPPNPQFGVEVQGVPHDATPIASTVEMAEPGMAHLLWASPRGAIEAAALRTGAHGKAAGTPIRAPWPEAVVLASPHTTASGGLRAVLADRDLKEAQAMIAEKLSAQKLLPLDLGGATPIGPHAVFWTQRDTLEFVWAAQKARTVQYLSLDLEAPDETLRSEVLAAPGSILRLDCASESPAPQARRQGLLVERAPGEAAEDEEDADEDSGVHDPEDRVVLWALCAKRSPQQLVLMRRTLPRGPEREVARFDVTDEVKGALAVVDSLIAHRGLPMYLLMDEGGGYWYASTAFHSLRRLDELAGEAVKADQFPALVAASKASQDPWVYARFASEREGGFRYVLIEPTGAVDPYDMLEERVTALRWG